MDIELMKSAVDYSLKQIKAGVKLVNCPKECVTIGCELSNCMENGLMADYIRDLTDISNKLDGWRIQLDNNQQYQHLWTLDEAISNLQLTHKLDVDNYNRPVTIIINGFPHVLDFNPALANDLQRLLHRQIATHYADDIE